MYPALTCAMNSYAILFILAFATFQLGGSLGMRKKENMDILMFFDGQPGKAGCQIAAQVVIDQVNSITDILPQYNLVPRIYDSGKIGNLVGAGAMSYLREGANKSSLLSPIVIGPNYACDNSAQFMKKLGFTVFSAGCIGPFILQRRPTLYSTLYLSKSPAMHVILPQLFFVSKMGGWKEMSIVTNANNKNEYLQALKLQELATANGIDVLHYGNEMSITDDTMLALKATRTRVISLTMVGAKSCAKFLCYAHRNGMTPPKYVFLLSFCMFTPATVGRMPAPPWCKKEMLLTQLKGSFFAGAAKLPPKKANWGNISLGYDLSGFDERYNKYYKKHARVTDHGRRYACHDAALAAVLALNQTEKILNEAYNKTLKDFTSESALVQQVANSSAAATDFVGLRIGRIVYNKRREVQEGVYMQQVDGNRVQVVVNLTVNESYTGDAEVDVEMYTFNAGSPPVWYTKSGKPPKDLSTVERRVLECNKGLVWTVVALAAASSLGICSLVVFNLRMTLKNDKINLFLTKPKKVLAAVACLLLNFAAVVIMTGTLYFKDKECRIRPVLTILGIAILNAVVAVMVSGYSQLRFERAGTMVAVSSIFGTRRTGQVLTNATQHSTNPTKIAAKINETESNHRLKFADGKIAVSVGAMLIVLIVWAAVDPFSRKQHLSDIGFDEVGDVYFEEEWFSCTSDHQIIFLAVALALQGCQLLYASFYAYKARHIRLLPTEFRQERGVLQLTAGNTLILFVATIFIVVILSSSTTECSQLAAIAVGEISYAFSTALVLLVRV